MNSVGKVEGFISPAIKGKNGFGYDPIFIPLGKKITFGEMRASQKYKIDHRFKAFKIIISTKDNFSKQKNHFPSTHFVSERAQLLLTQVEALE